MKLANLPGGHHGFKRDSTVAEKGFGVFPGDGPRLIQ
jgi:hypothetical protein